MGIEILYKTNLLSDLLGIILPHSMVVTNLLLPLLFSLLLFDTHVKTCIHTFVHTACVYKDLYVTWLLPACADCYTRREAMECEDSGKGNIWFNQTCYNNTYLSQFNTTTTTLLNCTNQTTTTTTDNDIVEWQSRSSQRLEAEDGCVNLTRNWLRESLEELSRNRVSAGEEYFQ